MNLFSLFRKRKIPQSDHEWVSQNMPEVQQYKGKWIAVTEKGIIAVSNDFNDVCLKSEGKGIKNPLIFKVPIGGFN